MKVVALLCAAAVCGCCVRLLCAAAVCGCCVRLLCAAAVCGCCVRLLCAAAVCALINVRSIRNKALLVRDYIDERELDVVALTETWLGEDKTTAVSELCGEDFTFVHQPRGGARRGGGVGVLFRKTLQLVSRANIDTHASETCRVILRNIRIGCTMRTSAVPCVHRLYHAYIGCTMR